MLNTKMAKMESCSIGVALNSMCHKNSHTRTSALEEFSTYSETDQTMILWRCDLQNSTSPRYQYSFFTP